ncbi:MAG: IS66 family insertion sequence element accessory protein TnpB [Oscillospiraceae bacterium]|nr:IS66 family insertion sequence element accessory protein TnpB [Oscillospiraceae bacterium]
MLGGITVVQVYIVCGYTDLRRSIDGLAAIVKQNYGMNPYDRSLFPFCVRRRDRIKGLLWDEDGFLLLYKRLNDGSFQWPRSKSEMKLLSREQFVWLMQGLSIEQPKAIRKRTPGDLM